MSYDVLVVDDSGVTRAMVIKSLSLAQIPIVHCYQAGNGREALEVLEDHWVDIVLADLNMPIMGGQELFKIMRGSRQLADTPVIVVTSESWEAQQFVDRWSDAAYVRKPFTPDEIRNAFGRLVAARQQTLGKDWLLERFASVLESVAFMFPAALPEGEEPPASGEFFRARMSFSGSASGVISLMVPRLLAVQMAADALGIEPDDPVAINHDADMAGELLNITCGYVVDTIAAGGDVQLEPPVVIRHDAARWEELARDPLQSWCLVEGQPVVIGLGTRVKALTVRVLIVDDSSVARRIITRALSNADDIEVVGSAADPFEAESSSSSAVPTCSRWTSRCRAWTVSRSSAGSSCTIPCRWSWSRRSPRRRAPRPSRPSRPARSPSSRSRTKATRTRRWLPI